MPTGRSDHVAAPHPVANSTLIVICQSLQALAFGGIALFLPIIRDDVGLTFAQGGTLAAATTLTYALMQIPAGILADRFDAKRLFVVGVLGTNVMTMLFAVLSSYELLVLNQAVAGVFRALIFAPGLILISQQFPRDRQATAMGLYVAGGMSSNIVLNALGPWLVDPLGWRVLFILFSLTGVMVVLGFAAIGDRAERDPSVGSLKPRATGRMVRHPVMWLTGYIQFVRLAIVMGVTFWLPSLVVEDKGFSLAIAGAVVAVGAAVTAPANLLGGWVSDKLGRPLSVIGLSLGVLTVCLSLIPVVDDLWTLMVVVVVMSIFIQLYFGPLFSVPVRFLGSANTGLVSGIGNFCANLGAFVFTYGLGVVKDSTGSFDVGLILLASLSMGGVLATYLVSRLPQPTPSLEVGDFAEKLASEKA